MEIFYYVVKLKNFSRAAIKLSLSKSQVSKRITQLEKELQTKLLTRSTRQLTLTETGKVFYEYCSNIVNEAEKSHHIIEALQAKPKGLLKISIAPALGLTILKDMLPSFFKENPQVVLDLQLENRIIDIIQEGFDLAIRSAALPDSNLVAQKIGTIDTVICATPKYLKTHHFPKNPSELHQHNCCYYSYPKPDTQWHFAKNGSTEIISIKGNLCSNQLQLIKQMALQNICIGKFPYFMVKNEIETGKLEICLPHYQLPKQNLYVVYPNKDYMPLKVKAFITTLKNYLKHHAILNK